MAHKLNPNAMRLNLDYDWYSVWYAETPGVYRDQLAEDLKIKKFIRETLKAAGLHRIVIRRKANMMDVEIHVSRPGVAIGRGGNGIDELIKKLKKFTKSNVDVKILEVKKPDLSPDIIARSIAEGIERRQSPKILMSTFRDKAIASGAKGIKIWIGGRIGGASQARTIKTSEGPVPTQTLRANVSYAEARAQTVDSGIMGIKVWIYQEDNN